MNTQEMVDLCLAHSMYSWSATGSVDPLPVARAEGVYFYTTEGKRFLDFNSQLMSVNIGHSHPRVIAAMKAQLDSQLLYCFPATATEVRARLSKKLADITPGNLNTFFFTLSGAESNENAIKAARLYTGRHKILARYRSYHGATNACMQLTGDPRRLANEPGMPGVIHVMDPQPYHYSFGSTDEEIVANNLRYLEEVIMYEGPDNIAAMFIETVTGTNGILPPPKGYLQGLRKLLTRHGILLVCDEVMSGFGRTGKLFAFEHGGIVPDIVTMAKGLTSSYTPLGAMAISDPIAEHFRENIFWGGLTYNAHALSCATALANIEVLLDEDLIGNSARLGAVMREEMDRLTAKHPSLKVGRNIGLFGMLDIQKNSRGDLIAPYNGSHPAMKQANAYCREQGMFTFFRWSHIMCNPPLCIREEQVREGFAILDGALDITDAAFEG
jgi:taurine--2-oxoglutarate transaminase